MPPGRRVNNSAAAGKQGGAPPQELRRSGVQGPASALQRRPRPSTASSWCLPPAACPTVRLVCEGSAVVTAGCSSWPPRTSKADWSALFKRPGRRSGFCEQNPNCTAATTPSSSASSATARPGTPGKAPSVFPPLTAWAQLPFGEVVLTWNRRRPRRRCRSARRQPSALRRAGRASRVPQPAPTPTPPCQGTRPKRVSRGSWPPPSLCKGRTDFFVDLALPEAAAQAASAPVSNTGCSISFSRLQREAQRVSVREPDLV